MFIKTVEPSDATGEIAALYKAEILSMGQVMQATQCWSARPDVIVPIENLLHQIRDGFSLGLLNFRLITFVVAVDVPSSYCSHVYFRSLSSELGRDRVLAIRKDYRNAGLAEQQVEMLAYAQQITRDASMIKEADIQRLRDVGLTDVNIADIALAASFRNFVSRYFDAVGATVEPEFLDNDPVVREMMAVGRKHSDGARTV
ncbi:alkylhydroperoxidase [Neorhizobium sp. AL 9.2.2]|uniref:alkylhydroperoxidase n=1 Tax=Neorhizobium sp. AL 9.2.2 TaxID=2712894 RepID=UPI001573AB71|nr:alkylhydroperoxidase [Neorhizobium sp. AL 9.2.2]NSY20076.1 alkylhydroperoxidase [Neorhizobium sp. AL 9.2.2]